MLKINLEFRKGILFVRLQGALEKNTIKKFDKQVIHRIRDGGIREVVLNMRELKRLDGKGINYLLYSYELCHQNHGNLFLCGITSEEILKKIRKYHLPKYCKIIESELYALEKVQI